MTNFHTPERDFRRVAVGWMTPLPTSAEFPRIFTLCGDYLRVRRHHEPNLNPDEAKLPRDPTLRADLPYLIGQLHDPMGLVLLKTPPVGLDPGTVAERMTEEARAMAATSVDAATLSEMKAHALTRLGRPPEGAHPSRWDLLFRSIALARHGQLGVRTSEFEQAIEKLTPQDLSQTAAAILKMPRVVVALN